MFDAVESAILAVVADGTAFAGVIVAAVLTLIISIGLVKKVGKKSA